MHNRREETKKKIIEIIKNNDISEIEKYFQKSNGFLCDFLVIAIENDVSIEVIEFLLSNAKIKTVNYVFSGRDDRWKTPLSLALEKNNFSVADLLIEYGASIYSIPITTFLFNNRNIKYILYKGVNSDFFQNSIYHLIVQNNEKSNIYLKKIFYYSIFDITFILKLLSFYKNKIPLSCPQLNNIILKEKGKIEINKTMYSQAVYHNNFETLNILYDNDLRKTDIILNEFMSLFDIEDFRYSSINSKEFINKFNSKEINIPVDNKFLFNLKQFHYNRENLLSFEDIKNKLKLLIQQDNIEELRKYLEERHIQLFLFSEKNSPKDDLLFYAIKNNVSLKMLSFIIRNAQYKDLNYVIYEEAGEVGTLLSFTLSHHKFKYFDFIMKNGATINNEHVDLLRYLYINKLLNSKNLKYIINNNYRIELDIIYRMVEDKEVGLLKSIFKLYTFGNGFILKLLSYYKNQTELTDKELHRDIAREQNKLEFTDTLYESAIEDKNFEILNLLYDNDNRPKDIILNELFHLLDTAELNHEGIKQEFADNFQKGILKIPFTEHYINNLCNIETIRKFILEKIQENDLDELQNYIKIHQLSLSNINNGYFDILIYTIKQNASLEMIKYIIPNYKSLNYTIHKYESPLFCAIYNNKFAIADLLLKNGANFNFIFNNLDIFYKRYRSKFYSESKVHIFKYILSHGFITINSKFIITLIRYNENEFLNMIFKYYIFDDIFILNFLSVYKNGIRMSGVQLKHTIVKEKEKFINFECLYEAITNDNNEVLELFFNHIDREKVIPLKLAQLFRLLDEAIRRDNSQFIKSLLSFKLPNFDKKSFSKMGKYLFTNKCHNFDIMKHIIERLLDNESNNFKEWDITKVLLYKEFRVDNNIELLKVFIQNSLSHSSFDFKSIHFEDLLVTLSEYNDISLMKFTIKEAIPHPTFNFDAINFNIVFILLNGIDISLLKFFINKLFSCVPPTLSIITTVLLTFNKVKNDDLMKYTIDNIFSNDAVNFHTNIDIQKMLEVASTFENHAYFKYIIEKIASHKSLELKSIFIEKVLIAMCKITNSSYIEFIIEKILEGKFGEKNIFESTEIAFEKIIMTAIHHHHHHHTYTLEYVLSHLIKIPGVNRINFEKYLLASNKINNLYAITLIMEKILKVSSLEPELDDSYPDLSVIKTVDVQYFSLIINSLVRLRALKLLTFLMTRDELKGRFNINETDRNADYPIIVSVYVDDVEIIDYLMENGADCNVKNINNVPLLFIALQNRKYYILGKLIKDPVFIKAIIRMNCSTILEDAIYHNQADKVKCLYDEPLGLSMEVCLPNHFLPLTLAYLLNHTEIFDFLIQNSEITELDYHGYNILHYAILKEDLPTVQKILNLHQSNIINSGFLREHSPFLIAMKLKNMEILSLLLDDTNKIISSNDLGGKINHLITELFKRNVYSVEEITEIVKLFIEKGIKMNLNTKEHLTILDYALDNDSLPLIKVLLNHSIEANRKNTDIIRYLIDNKDDIDINSSDEAMEAMSFIIQNNYVKLLQFLIRHDLDINKRDKNDKTILIYAIEAQNSDMIQYLRHHGADIDSLSIDIDMGLYEKIINLNQPDLYKIIYNHKSFNMEQKDDRGHTVFTYSLRYGDRELVRYLIDQGIDVTTEGKNNELPLSLSTRFNDISLVHDLIDKGADINKGDQSNDTALIGAIENGSDLSMVAFLIDNEADVNKKGKYGDTALAVAVNNNNIEVVKYLLEHDADVNEACDDGDFPIGIAMLHGNFSMVQCLTREYQS